MLNKDDCIIELESEGLKRKDIVKAMKMLINNMSQVEIGNIDL